MLELSSSSAKKIPTMSFGFGVPISNDVASLAYSMYRELRDAAGACGAFGKELFQCYQILQELERTILSKNELLDDWRVSHIFLIVV